MRGWPELLSFFAALFFLPIFLIAQEPHQSTPGTQIDTQNAMPETSPQPTLSEIDLYKNARTLISWIPVEIDNCAFLQGLRPAVSQDQLPEILEQVGQTCTRSYHDFLDVTCDEEVISRRSNVGQSLGPQPTEQCDPDSRLRQRTGSEDLAEMGDRLPHRNHLPGILEDYPTARRNFRFIVLRRPHGDLPVFEEYRTDLRGKPVNLRKLRNPRVMTWDFTSTFLNFSRADQQDNRYRYFGIQSIRNRECHVVGFAQDPENFDRIVRVYSFGESGPVAVVLLQGMAWIDVQTFQILRVRVWLLAPRDDVGLSSATSTVDFYPFQPPGTERELWLPKDVSVDELFRGPEVHETHYYSNYKLFRVESTIKPLANTGAEHVRLLPGKLGKLGTGTLFSGIVPSHG
jgi:hypothetical protein